jgi:hypothetical protein
MIETIYIPTIRRAKDQVTYNNLPDNLKQRVCMVIQESERHLYDYPCEYLVLPDHIVGSYTQLSQTRKFIHTHAGDKKYLMIDDDIVIKKRNRKYFGFESDMDVSRRDATPSEINELFDRASVILDNPGFGLVGISSPMFCVDTTEVNCSCVTNVVFADGRKISKFIDKLDTSVRVAEDIMFMFFILSHGLNTKVLYEFTFINKSEGTSYKNKRPIWEDPFDKPPKDVFQTDMHYNDLRYIQSLFEGSMTITQDSSGKWKNVKHWKKVYNSAKNNNLLNFM